MFDFVTPSTYFPARGHDNEVALLRTQVDRIIVKRLLVLLLLQLYATYAALSHAVRLGMNPTGKVWPHLDFLLWSVIAVGLWRLKWWGWSIAVLYCGFVMCASMYLVVNWPETSGPELQLGRVIEMKNIAIGAILMLYLLEDHVRRLFLTKKSESL